MGKKTRHVCENALCQKLAKTNKNQHFSIFDSSNTVHYKCLVYGNVEKEGKSKINVNTAPKMQFWV